MKQEFKNQIFFLLNELNIKNILHIGAYDGSSELDFYDNLKVNSIVWVEGNLKIIEKLKNNTNQYNNIKHFIYNKVVSDNCNVVNFNLIGSEDVSAPDNMNLGCSSILTLKKHAELYPGISQIHSVSVETTTIDNIYKENALPKPDLINIDVQGAELLVLKGSESILNTVKSIFCETADIELYENCVLKPVLSEYLKQYGFEEVLYCPHDFCWGDTLYIKKQ